MNPDLLDELRGAVGAARVVTDPGIIGPRLVDERRRYHGSAACVVRPRATAEVAAVVAACARHGVPVVPQGGNTSLCGAATPLRSDSVIIDIAAMRAVRSVDTADDTMTVECGMTVAEARAAAADHGRLFPLRFGADATATLGGALGTNAGGSNVLRYGMARDLTLGVEVVLADGRVLDDLRGLRKDNTGFDLTSLFVGSEGTLGVMTAATLALFPLPEVVVTAVAAVPDAAAAVAFATRLRSATDGRTSAIEWMSTASGRLVADLVGARVPFDDTDLVLVEVDGSGRAAELGDLVLAVLDDAASAGEITDAVLAPDEAGRSELWAAREAVPEAGKRAGGAVKHDVSVAASLVPAFLDRAGAGLAALGLDLTVSAFGHLGDGNIHYNVVAPGSPEVLAEREEEITRIVFDVVADLGGSFSAEHGIGRLRVAELARRADPVALDVMARIKSALDPDAILNPGVVLDPGAVGFHGHGT